MGGGGEGGRHGVADKWHVLLTVVCGTFMVVLDTTVVNVAFPTVRGEFHATLGAAQWILSIYVLALGIGTPLAGFVGERFGVRRVYIGGLLMFATGSIGSGLAPRLWVLIASRAFQGFGGGLAQTLATAMLFRAFPKEEQGRALGYFGIVLLVAPALGPILGGVLIDANAWRFIFFVNIPVAVVGILLAWRWMRVPEERHHDVPLDPWGLALAVVGFGAALYAAAQAQEQGWTSVTVLASFGIAAVALTAFALVELFRAPAPLLNLRLYRDRTFTTAAVVGYITVLALFGAEFLLPIYLQSLRGQTALEAGIILLPLGITAGIVTPIAGRLYDAIGPRPLAVTGFVVLAVNTWELSELDARTGYDWIMVLMALRGFALGCALQTTLTAALGSVPKAELPRGTSLLNGTRRVVQSIGVALLATVLTSAVSPRTRAVAAEAQAQEALRPTAAREYALCPDAATSTTGDPAPLLEQACRQYLTGFEVAYRWTFYFSLAALAASLFLPGWPARWVGRGDASAVA